MNISNLDKAEVLVALYCRAQSQGLGVLSPSPSNMTKEDAATILETTTYFDYLYGRVMKIDLSGNEVDTYLYNRDNGENAAENAIERLIS